MSYKGIQNRTSSLAEREVELLACLSLLGVNPAAGKIKKIKTPIFKVR